MIIELFNEILNNYIDKTKGCKFNKDQDMFKLVNYKTKDSIKKLVDIDGLEVKGSCGAGQWTDYPWIAIYNESITKTIQEGVYIVYLFSKDMERVYLTLNQGCTKLKEKLGKVQANEEMIKVRELVRSKLDNRGFSVTNDLEIGNKDYENGSIFYKEYRKNNLPSEGDFLLDLNNMISIYNDYYKQIFQNNEKVYQTSAEVIEKKGKDKSFMSISELEISKQIQKYINSRGFTYNKKDLNNFILSLKTKPFVILAGISGTGKSKLVKLFANAIGATSENDQYNIISVKPDWNDSTELFGYKNINDEFIPGKLTDIIKIASRAENINNPYFICLDEMNLARVEYYLSEYLSIIESREFKNGEIITDKLFQNNYLTRENEYFDLRIPENIYIIGTVNMDDTTFAFSRKVLDRANTIEFSDVHLDILDFEEEECDPILVDNNFLKTRFLNIKEALAYDRKFVEKINNKIKDINEILKKCNKNFGYRVRDEIVFYMLENKIVGLLDEDVAFDYQIMQKILPTISGSESYIKQILIELFKVCLKDEEGLVSIADFNECEKIMESDKTKENEDSKKIKYKKSAEKILMMLRGYEDGFTSFWA